MAFGFWNGTRILTQTGQAATWLEIEKLNAGDEVIGMRGERHTISSTSSMIYSGFVIELYHLFIPEPIYCIEAQKILSRLRPRSLGGNADWSGSPINATSLRRALRRNATPAEKHLWSYLRGKQTGMKFRRQHSIGPYIVDFYCREASLVVEVDGGVHFTPQGKEKDIERDLFLRDRGLEVLHFTNDDIINRMNAVWTAINEHCQEYPFEYCDENDWHEAGELQKGDSVFFGMERKPVRLLSTDEIKVENQKVFGITIRGGGPVLTELGFVDCPAYE